MATPIFVCGAECGIAVVGQTSAGTEHWSAVGGSPSVVTSGPTTMRSTRCFRHNPSAATCVFTHTFASAIASGGTAVARFYIYFASLPAATCEIFWFQSSGTNLGGVLYHGGTTQLRAQHRSSAAASGATVVTGVWYQVDVKLVATATGTTDIQVNGIAQTQATATVGATTITSCHPGNQSTATADYYIDDIVVSGTSGDYPIGPGIVAGLYPSGDLTNSAANPTDGNGGHLYSAVTDFGKGASGATDLGAQNVESTSWQSLAKPLSSSTATNFISNRTGSSTERLTHTFEQLPANADTVHGAMLVCATHSASTTSNNFEFDILRGDFGFTFASISADLSETSITLPCSAQTAAMTVAEVNGIRSFFVSTDVNPDVYLDGACFEVAYTEIVGPLQAIAARRR